LKIHIAVDIKSKKIFSVKVTGEHIHDSKVLPKLVDNVVKLIKNMTTFDKAFADGAMIVMLFLNVLQIMNYTMHQSKKKC
jgi:hypothetical protein